MIGSRSQTNHSLTADEILLILFIAPESPVPNIGYLDQSERRQSSSILQHNLYRTRLAESVLASIANFGRKHDTFEACPDDFRPFSSRLFIDHSSWLSFRVRCNVVVQIHHWLDPNHRC